MNELREQKSILAKLMATENITVRHAKVPTAGFDPRSRTLLLPILKEMEGEVYDLFVCHEVGHALHTPAEGWHKALCEEGPNYKGFLNIVEDARIEKLVKRKYHGAAKAMHKGYKKLIHERDFFGIQKNGLDINKGSLIDKLNVHFKGGPLEAVRFTDEEMYYVREMENLETWDDVEQLTGELFEYCKGEEQQLQDFDQMSIDLEEDDEFDEDEDENECMGENYQEFAPETPSEENPESEDQATKEDCEQPVDTCDESTSKEDGEKEETQLEQNADAENQGSPEKKEEKKDSTGKDAGTGGHDSWYEEDPWTWEPKAFTDEEHRSHEDELVHEDAIEIRYYNSPKMYIKNNDLIVDYKTLIKQYRTITSDLDGRRKEVPAHICIEYAKEYLKRIDKDNKPVVNYLAKEFEMKKRATEYKRSQTSNSGIISLTDIHKYKYSDNIFKKVTIIPEGKNHGLYMLVDWSGSMHDKILPTFIQLLQLMDFCRKCDIKHEVYAFVDYSWDEEGKDITGEKKERILIEPEIGSITTGDRCLTLMQMFSDKMSAKDFREMREFMVLTLVRCDKDFHDAPWTMQRKANAIARAEHFGRKPREVKETMQFEIWRDWAREKHELGTWEWQAMTHKWDFPMSRLCGTPLNDAIMLSIPNCIKFRKDNKLDIVNTIILTDGESNSSNKYFKEYFDEEGESYKIDTAEIEHKDVRNKLVDRDSKKVFNWSRKDRRQETKNFLEYYKWKTSSNVCGFFLCTSSETAGRVGSGSYYSPEFREKRKEYNRNGFIINTDLGYTELYVIKANTKVDTEDEIDLDTDKKLSTAQITRAFKKFQKGKLEKRILLNHFAELVA